MSSRDEKTRRLPPGQRATERILRWGIDHAGIKPENPRVNIETYQLTIDGEVENPVSLNWSEILQLPKTQSTSDFHCVEGWSVLDCHWKGVHFKEIEKIVRPRKTSSAATFGCADDYSTSLFLSELHEDDVLLAYELNGEMLEEGLGFPLRLIVPSKYAYKSALWVTRIRFTKEKELGFWERRGYSDAADVWKNDRFSR